MSDITLFFVARRSNGKTLDRLLNSEKHFIQILMKLQSDFLVPLAATSYRGTDGPIGQYKRAVQQLIDVHRDILYPRLVQCEQDIVAMCTIYRDAFTSAQFLDAYLLYASTCVHAYAILFGKYSDASGKSPMVDYTRWPQVHLDRTFAYMDHLMLELKDADETFVSDEFKAVVRFGVQLDQFRTRYRDNANLNAMTMETAGNYTPTYESRRSFYETYGFVEWGEACSVYGYKTRLLLLTSGLVCVRTKEVKVSDKFRVARCEWFLMYTIVCAEKRGVCQRRVSFATFGCPDDRKSAQQGAHQVLRQLCQRDRIQSGLC